MDFIFIRIYVLYGPFNEIEKSSNQSKMLGQTNSRHFNLLFTLTFGMAAMPFLCNGLLLKSVQSA